MEQTRYLIIGGGVAGTTAAETIRQHDKDGRLIIVSDEPHLFYSRIMLSKPNFFLEKIPFDNIWLKKREWYEQNKVEFFGGVLAEKIDSKNKVVELSDRRQIQYEKLLIAIGGEARRWDPAQIKGADKNGVYYLRDLSEAKEIIDAIKTAKRAVCIGGGFVSFETCELLRMKGIETTLLIMEPYYWANIWDETSGLIVEDYLKQGGVSVLKNELAQEVLGAEKVEAVKTKSGKEIPCDMVVVGIGLVCPTKPFADAGIGCSKGIKTNEYLETGVSDVWAAGDVAEFQDIVVGESVQLGNWVNAQTQGRIAALGMVGKRMPFRMVSFYTTQAFGLSIAFVGDVRPLPDRKIITRGSRESKSYGRIIIKENEIVGATLLNRTPEMAAISRLIEKDVDISGYLDKLADSNFDLKEIIPVSVQAAAASV